MKLFLLTTMLAAVASAQLFPVRPVTAPPAPAFKPMVLTPVPVAPPVAMPAPVYGTQMQVGNTVYYNDSTGTTGTSMRVGNQTYSTYQNGGKTTTCTASKIGGTVYSNCN